MIRMHPGRRPLAVIAVLVVVICHGPAPADTGKGADKAKAQGKSEGKERPACVHCGATCGLVAFCECKPGTKKTQKTEYDTTCDPVCVPGCSGPPWPWRHRPAAGCTGCASGCTECAGDCCNAWVRQRKKLVKETKDEEKAVVERKVVWVCRGCDGGPSAGCTGGSGAGAGKAGWWPTWLCWPYAKP
jgi:hypothetical protein